MKSTKKILDLSSLQKAITSLLEAITAQKSDPNNSFIRDATIQRFEYTYELCVKMLRRYLELTEPSAIEIDQLSFPNLIRTASERGLLLNGWDQWQIYRNARNITSHTYDQDKALSIIKIVGDFLADAEYLISKLITKN